MKKKIIIMLPLTGANFDVALPPIGILTRNSLSRSVFGHTSAVRDGASLLSRLHRQVRVALGDRIIERQNGRPDRNSSSTDYATEPGFDFGPARPGAERGKLDETVFEPLGSVSVRFWRTVSAFESAQLALGGGAGFIANGCCPKTERLSVIAANARDLICSRYDHGLNETRRTDFENYR